jgi:hypothetical protein
MDKKVREQGGSTHNGILDTGNAHCKKTDGCAQNLKFS